MPPARADDPASLLRAAQAVATLAWPFFTHALKICGRSGEHQFHVELKSGIVTDVYLRRQENAQAPQAARTARTPNAKDLSGRLNPKAVGASDFSSVTLLVEQRAADFMSMITWLWQKRKGRESVAFGPFEAALLNAVGAASGPAVTDSHYVHVTAALSGVDTMMEGLTKTARALRPMQTLVADAAAEPAHEELARDRAAGRSGRVARDRLAARARQTAPPASPMKPSSAGADSASVLPGERE